MAKPKTILVVEDHEGTRDLLREALTTMGYFVLASGNGKEALEQIATRRPDLVLTDLNMPILDGYELIRRIREAESLKRLPVVAISAQTEQGEEWILDHGFDAYLSKPFDFKTLRRQVAETLEISESPGC